MNDGKPDGIMELGVPAEARKAVYQLAKMAGAKHADDYVLFSFQRQMGH